MDYSKIFAISAAGMAAERTRVEVAALNLANANTVGSTDGGVFAPLRVVTRAIPLANASGEEFGVHLMFELGRREVPEMFVPEAIIEPSGALPRSLYEPGHPLANASGFVIQPGVDTATEMVTIMSAMRAYEANVAAANAGRTLALKTLEIGGGS
jgi:flagellar basal-body rod protein FlgC